MYWIYEFEMPEEDKNTFLSLAEKEHMTPDQMIARWISYLYDHPEKAGWIKESWDAMSEEEKNRIRLVRITPVYDGESENEAFGRERQDLTIPEMTAEESAGYRKESDGVLGYGQIEGDSADERI